MAIDGVDDFRPDFGERWRHGGWYVGNVRYPSGAVGCVSNNYTDKLWRMACHRPELTFSSRADAAKAEKIYVDGLHEQAKLLAVLESLFEHCAMLHKHWGEGCNQRQADAAIKAGLAAIALAKGGA